MKKPGKISKGDIVVIPFPFSDLKGQKRRPAMVLATFGGQDAILCQITSVHRLDGHAVPLRKVDFAQGGLPVDSIIRPSKLFTADSLLILYKAGMVRGHIIDAIESELRIIFGL